MPRMNEKNEIWLFLKPLLSNLEWWVFISLGGLWQVGQAKRSGIKIDWVYLVLTFSSCILLGLVIMKGLQAAHITDSIAYVIGLIVSIGSNNILISIQDNIKSFVKSLADMFLSALRDKLNVTEEEKNDDASVTPD